MGPRANRDQPGGRPGRQGRESGRYRATPQLMDGGYDFNEWLLADRNIFNSQTKLVVSEQK